LHMEIDALNPKWYEDGLGSVAFVDDVEVK
jgi:hypothetical protein